MANQEEQKIKRGKKSRGKERGGRRGGRKEKRGGECRGKMSFYRPSMRKSMWGPSRKAVDHKTGKEPIPESTLARTIT